jgi:hypothetical protein
MQVSLAWLGRDPAPTLLYKSMALHEESRHSLPGHRRINLFCFNWSTQPLTSVANHRLCSVYFSFRNPFIVANCIEERASRLDSESLGGGPLRAKWWLSATSKCPIDRGKPMARWLAASKSSDGAKRLSALTEADRNLRRHRALVGVGGGDVKALTSPSA